jgi:two-component system phosphate regulon response regulator PhoB
MKKEKVLLVEDAPDMQMIVRATIGNDCELTCAGSIAEAEKQLSEKDFGLLLLDVVLPDGSGFDYCQKLRAEGKFKNLPIFFLTGQDDVDKRVMGFELGGDDYITKPFEPNEFKARIFGKLKRANPGTESSFSRGIFSVDWGAQKASMTKKDGSRVELALTPIEFKLLVQFLRHEGRTFSREELLVAVWGSSVHVSGHTVDTHISSLRKKVGDFSSYFKAVVKKGYCYSPN